MKKLLLISLVMVSGACFADSQTMAQDILVQITHGPVNADSNLDDSTANKTVVLSLKSAIVYLACQQNYTHESNMFSKCLATKKPNNADLGQINKLAIDVGNNAAISAITGHSEMKTDNYAQVINYLQIYANNITTRLINN